MEGGRERERGNDMGNERERGGAESEGMRERGNREREQKYVCVCARDGLAR